LSIRTKICGLSTQESLGVAIEAGADFVGFVFFPPSPRAVTPEQAAELASVVPGEITKVGLFVDADDATIAATLDQVPLQALQLHGSESVRRLEEISSRFDLPVMKAVKVETAADVAGARIYQDVADWLLFDAKAPKNMAGALPGGNALSFDWRLLQDQDWTVPWMLCGGLDAANVAEAVKITGAAAVDVSSGVEDRPGHKDPARIRAFLDVTASL
jgi:phosphoribosylanthranilate isomerase